MAPAGAGPGARRSHPDVVAVHARSCRPPTTARWPRGSSSCRSTCGCRPPRSRASSRRPEHATSSSAPAATRRTRARRDSSASRRRPSRRSAPNPAPDDPAFPPDWEARQAAWTPPDRAGGLRARLHLGDHRDAQGRDADPRQRRRLDRVVPPDRPADGAPAGVAAPAVAPARAGGRAVLRARRRGRHPVRPQPEPAGHLRRAARPAGDLDGGRAAGPRPVLERHRARGREARPHRRRSIGSGRSPGTSRCGSVRGSSGRSTTSWAATSACSCRPGRSSRRRSSRPGRTSGSRCCRATAPPRPGPGRRRRSRITARARSAAPPEGIEMRLAPDGEVQFRGRTVFSGYWQTPRGDRSRVHRRRLVPHRRRRPSRRRAAASSCPAEAAT